MSELVPPALIDFVNPVLLVLLADVLQRPDSVHLLPDSLVAGKIADLVCKCPQPLDVVRLVNDACCALNIPVEALQRVIRRRKAQALLRVSEPPDSGLKLVGPPCNRRRQLVCLRPHAKGLAHPPEQTVGYLVLSARLHGQQLLDSARAVFPLEMREVAAAVVDRLIAVPHSSLVDVPEHLIVDAPERFYAPPDFRLVELRILLPQLLHQRLPLLQALPVPLLDVGMPLQHADIVLRLTQQLHGVGLADDVSVLHLPAEPQLLHAPAHLVLVALGLRLGRPDWCKVGLVDGRARLLAEDVQVVPRHRLPAQLYSKRLVLGLIDVFEEAFRLACPLRPYRALPFGNPRRRHAVFKLCLKNPSDGLAVLRPLQRLHAALAAHQLVEDLLVLLREQGLAHRPLVRPPLALELLVKRLHVLQRLRPSGLVPLLQSLPGLGVAPCHPQGPLHVLNRDGKVVLGVTLILLGPWPRRLVQRPLHDFNAS